MTGRNLRWGLLSTARINSAVIPGLQSSQKNELYAVASRSQNHAEEYARQHNIPHAYGSYEALLADPNIDVIYNSLPNHLHAEWTIKAAQRGIHTLCEKPMALSTSEVDAIIATAAQNKVIIMEAFMYRHHPRTSKVKEILSQGLLGDIRFLRGSFTYFLARPEDYRWIPEYGGGGLWDVGCYPLSYAMMIMGAAPKTVFGWQKTGPTGIDEYFAAQMTFENDVVAQIDCGTNAAVHTHFEIRGSLGTLWIAHPYNTRNNAVPILLRQGDQETAFTFEDVNGYKAQTENMADVILGTARPNITLQESAAINKALLALFESAREGKTLSL